jgi:2-oxopent-4-enoate/cis-2-oxohex-4-enoate hydratase
VHQEIITAYGDELYDAWAAGAPVAPLTTREANITIEDAYHTRMRTVARRVQAGKRVIGRRSV